MPDYNRILEAALAKARNRTSWNDRLAHWERPASDGEEAKIERAARMAGAIVANNDVLISEGAQVVPQGSYFNNTNVRLEADMDLRVQLPGIRTRYMNGVDPGQADAVLGYVRGRAFSDVASSVRTALVADLTARFGTAGVDASGNKAITVHGLDGSRADCDLVPAFRLHVVTSWEGRIFPMEGVAILGADGSWTENFPAQHRRNGIEKRASTRHRFKRVVRMLKRLNYELEELGHIPARLPGFLVESLAYAVEDSYYLVDADDRYGRLSRVVWRMWELNQDETWAADATEINGIKYLFRSTQSWTKAEVTDFVVAALNRIGAV